jgi:hypothetical protein
MSEAAAGVRSPRATVLVGYGAFGLGVLRRLLASAAPRGILAWEESRGGAVPSERSLQDLALVWVRDRTGFAGQEVDDEDASEGSSFEMMRDLYRQIQQVENRETPEADFAAAISAAAEKLLSASARAERRDPLPLGLDVIVLARPTSPEVVGSLDRLLDRGLERLANNANLERGVQGAEALSLIAILDFENYWDRNEQGRGVREAVHNSVEQWRKRRQAGRPAFGRVYLVDGRTGDGIRDERHRLDEISLFLELLLFEGQRSGELQRLYQSQGSLESPVATFGVRLMERSAGLLSHLAAARFGIGWLAYLAGTEPWRTEVEPVELRRRLAPYRPGELDGLLGREELERTVTASLAALERELMELPVAQADWPQQLRALYEETASRIEVSLATSVRTRLAEIGKGRLARLSEDLEAGIEADLHDSRNPVPLGTVIAEVEGALEQLGGLRDLAAPPTGAAEELLRSVDRLHASYRQFNRERVDVEGLRGWWWLFALALAAGLTPVVTELLAEVPRPDPTNLLLGRAFDLLQLLANPLAAGVALFALLWWLGARPLQRRVAARIERARRFYNDPDKGRFVDRIRDGLKPGGALRAPLDHTVDRLLLDLTLSVRGEISRGLLRIAARLRERRREMLWLREQLREFLRLHGVEERTPDAARVLRDGTGIRYSIERGEDLETMLKSNPPNPERFRSTQATSLPFIGWEGRHSRAFLHPIAFLDRLSEIYKDPFLRELATPGTGPEQKKRADEFFDFLAHQGTWSEAFQWRAQEGVPPDRRYCMLPAAWRRLPGVLAGLSDLRIPEEFVLDSADVARAYLLRLQTGVDPACLLAPA